MLTVNRDAVDDKYSVLPVMPLPTAREQLKWATNIFIGADLSETRTALADYPAITITYDFNLSVRTRHFLTGLETDKNEWMIPYLPHLTSAMLVGDNFTISTIANTPYVYGDYYVAITRNAMIYKRVGDYDFSSIDEIDAGDQMWGAPCFPSQINPMLDIVDVGKCRDGSTVALTFRMTGESEKTLTYETTSFDFLDSLQTPLTTGIARHQMVFTPEPARAYTYTPYAMMKNNTPIIEARYLLEYRPTLREEHPFKGVFMKGKGSYTADFYISPDIKHRLENDTLTIDYQQGVAFGIGMFREVEA